MTDPSNLPTKHLSIKHRRFIKNLVGGMGTSDSARMAGFHRGDYGNYLLKQPSIQSVLLAEMERAGITDDQIAAKMAEGLDCMAPPRKDGGMQYPDNFVRKQYLDLILRVRGDYAPEKTQHEEKRITLVMDGDMVKALADADAITDEDMGILDGDIVTEETGQEEGPKRLEAPSAADEGSAGQEESNPAKAGT